MNPFQTLQTKLHAQLLALCVLLISAVCIPSLAAAEPSVVEMVDALMKKQAAEPSPDGLKRRGLNTSQTAPAAGRLQLFVQFEFASANITAESRDLLVKLGAAMNSPALAGQRFRIEGHTDAVGDAQVNLRLSEQRAHSVRQFLLSNADIEKARLSAIGKGSSEPLASTNPRAALNRRVEVVALDNPALGSGAPAPTAASSAVSISPAATDTQLPSAGVVRQLQGAVSLTRANATSVLGPGAVLREGDTISTAPGASVLVQLGDGAKLLARPGAIVSLSRIDNSGAFGTLTHSIALAMGAIRYVTGSVGKSRPQAVHFKTPNATIGIRGTDLEIVHAPNQPSVQESGTYVRVNSGAIELDGNDGSKVSLTKNEQAFAAAPGPKLRGGVRTPLARKLDAPANVFSSGDFDVLLESP